MPSISDNHEAWNEAWDIARRGEEWTPSEEWRSWIVANGIEPFLQAGMRALEIGPGGGRWTERLLERKPAHLIGIDLSERCVATCRERFRDRPEAEFHANDGASLDIVPDESIDFVWSFDVFVHMEAPEIERYVTQLRRILAPGGIAAIHYPTVERAQTADRFEGWRGNYTAPQMLELVKRCEFELVYDFYSPYLSNTNTSAVLFRKPAGLAAR